MKVVIIEGPNGRRTVPPGPLTLTEGERVVGSEFVIGEDKTGISWGDAVAVLAKPFALILGKTDCKSCELRKEILNLYHKLGFTTVRELMAMSLKEPPYIVAGEIIRRLQECQRKEQK